MNCITDLLEYRDGKLFWKVRRGHVAAGKEAGSICKNGRLYIQFEGKKILAHRIVWAMHHGDCPEFLDHIDNNPLNNRIENLRPASKSQNAMNRKVRADSSTGIKGITPKGKRFGATIYLDGTPTYLGTFETKDLAHQAYVQAAKLNFKEYARCQ